MLQRPGYFQMKFSKSYIRRRQLCSDSFFKWYFEVEIISNHRCDAALPPRESIFSICLNSRLFGTLNQNGPIPSATSIPVHEVLLHHHLIYLHGGCQCRWGKERGIRICTRSQDHYGVGLRQDLRFSAFKCNES